MKTSNLRWIDLWRFSSAAEYLKFIWLRWASKSLTSYHHFGWGERRERRWRRSEVKEGQVEEGQRHWSIEQWFHLNWLVGDNKHERSTAIDQYSSSKPLGRVRKQPKMQVHLTLNTCWTMINFFWKWLALSQLLEEKTYECWMCDKRSHSATSKTRRQ